ncbi:hypothetical protein QYF61_002524 [Mycteria americana]|uniref:Uncharacterized protein n=1 Tax=Mycteria americana TaxID=33587 RepID=A0AAN7NW70_MYCAM|nr:hypothetical protein QYF61_002524 [Mycteria americana]
MDSEKVKQLPTLPSLLEDPCVVGLLRVKEQQVPIATTMVHHWQYRTNQDSPVPIHDLIHQLESQGVISKTQPPSHTLLSCGGHLELTIPGKHSPTICHGLIQTALEQGKAPEHLQYTNNIVWGNTVEEVFEKGKRIIQILLKAGFTI